MPGNAKSALRSGTALLVVFAMLAPAGAEARSSGGYSRPSISRPATRTPSTSSFSRPSSTGSAFGSGSGGYARPRERTPSVLAPSRSAGDIAVSRQSSQDALDRLRERQRPTVDPYVPRQERRRTPSVDYGSRDDGPSYAPSQSSTFDWPAPRRRNDDGYGGGWANDFQARRAPPVRPRWAGDPSWSAPSWASARTDAGPWNAVMLWYLLDTLSRPGHAEWFRQHRDDPGYASWRRAADAAAASDAGLRTKLSELDQSLGAALEAPRDAGYLPPDVSRDDARTSQGGGGFVLTIFLLLLLGGAVGGAYLFLRVRRNRTGMTRSNLDNLATVAGGAARNVLGKEPPPKAAPFRIGQVIDVDTTPFILADGKLQTKAPDRSALTVTGIGRLKGMPLTRLHVGEDLFLQVHLSDDGRVDECRLFTLLDRVMPASADEWAFWLPPGQPPEGGGDNEWSIGFPTFDTKDGTSWERVWNQGDNIVDPVEATETVETASGTKSIRQQAMLYARATGIEAPGPDREYLFLVAEQGEGGAGIAIHTGIDLPTAGMNLTA